MKKKVLLVLVAVALLIGLIVTLKECIEHLPGFLSPSEKVDANVLVVEGWLPVTVAEMSEYEIPYKNYDLILISGIQTTDLDFFKLPMNGYLVFYPKFRNTPDNGIEDHVIEITAKSKMGGIYQSHFNFLVNDSIYGDFNADEKPGKFRVIWRGTLKNIDSLAVQFTNDMVDENGDRDLYVKEVTIDNKINIRYQFNSVYDIGKIGGSNRTRNDYESHPQIVRNKLISFGIDSSKVVALTSKRTIFNRTLVSAMAVRDWLKSSELTIRGINIVSVGIHSRRTWLTYKRVLGKSYNIGIISLPEKAGANSGGSKVFGSLGEALDLIYYNIILFLFLFK